MRFAVRGDEVSMGSNAALLFPGQRPGSQLFSVAGPVPAELTEPGFVGFVSSGIGIFDGFVSFGGA
jgi:hypothetical protein